MSNKKRILSKRYAPDPGEQYANKVSIGNIIQKIIPGANNVPVKPQPPKQLPYGKDV